MSITGPGDASFERRAFAVLEEVMSLGLSDEEALSRAVCERSEGLLRERVLRLLKYARSQTDGPLVTGGGAQPLQQLLQMPLPEMIGKYTIEAEIGRGGMGVVYRGRRSDSDYDHVAAIKVVFSSLMSDQLVPRLRSERRVLSQLRHPNIAQFLDGGETEDGDPYLVIEYVEGEKLHDYVQHAQLTVDALLMLFEGICSAVAYAHHNLIVHRDLSPANILVTDEGMPKLIDFGISHTLGETDQAYTTHLTMTRGYAAPERREGRPASTLSDIYSLGVILDELLEHTTGSRLQDLRAVAAKASVADPELRYQNVEQLQDDLQRYRSGHPVSAVDAGWLYLLQRFLQRHAWGAGVALAVGVGLVAVAITTTLLYREAEAARQVADQRFAQVRDVANYLIMDLNEDLTSIAGATAIRADVVAQGQQYLDALAGQEYPDVELLLDIGKGYRRLGSVVGGLGESGLGRTKSAREYLAAAQQALSRAAELDPSRRDITVELADLQSHRSGVELYQYNDTDLGLQLAIRARQLMSDIARDSAASPRELVSFGIALVAEGEALLQAHHLDAALAPLEHARGVLQPLLRSAPDTPWLGLTYDKVLSLTGDTLFGLGRLQEADAVYLESVAGTREKYDSSPNAPKRRRDLAVGLWGHARILRGLEDYSQAAAMAQEASALMQRNVEEDPSDLDALRILSLMQQAEAAAQSGQGNHAAALSILNEGLTRLEVLRRQEPDTAFRHYDVYSFYQSFADVFAASGARARECEWLLRAVDGWRHYEARWESPGTTRVGELATLVDRAGDCPRAVTR